MRSLAAPGALPVVRIALLGAECTGKSTLADQLRQHAADQGLRCEVVPETLRLWCEQHQRTPRADEQAAIAQVHTAHVLQAQNCDWLVADTTALTTAVYSELLFGDTTLYPAALAHQRHYTLTLLLGTDLPWQADGIQRDGVAAQQRFDTRLRHVLLEQQLPHTLVLGQGPQRLQAALRAIERAHAAPPPEPLPRWRHVCEGSCSDPQCEQRLFAQLLERKEVR
ncbi:MAG: AAA family ATPase [Rhodoferax sp.]